MTCIVALAEASRVYMGGDSAAISGNEISLRYDPKVFKNGPFLIGITSSFRMGNLLRYHLIVNKQEDEIDDYRFMCTTFIDAVRTVFKLGGFSGEDEKNQEAGGEFLVGYHGEIYRISTDFQVGMPLDDWDAIGSGEANAKGALVILQHLQRRPHEKVRLALVAAEYLNTCVSSPFVFESI